MSADISPHPFDPIPGRPTYCAECFGYEPDAIHHAAPRLLALRPDGSCGTCGQPQSGHDQRHDMPGSPVLCLA